MSRTLYVGYVLCAVLGMAACHKEDDPSAPADTSSGGAAGDAAGDPTSAGGLAGMSSPVGDGAAGASAGDSAGASTATGGSVSTTDGSAVPPTDALSWPESSPPIYMSSQRQTARPLGSTTSATGYLEYLPPGYGDGVKRPLLVVVPGITENGNGNSDLPKVASRGPAMLIARNRWPDDRPFVVLSMQHLLDMECASGLEVHEFIAYALSAYAIDVQHVYVTGISCGAISSWNYLGSYGSTQVAAAVLIAGDGRPAWATAGCGLAAASIWAFHDQGDETIPAAGTIEPIDHLATCPSAGQEFKKTIYATASHDSWTATYDLSAGNDIYAWMLSKSR